MTKASNDRLLDLILGCLEDHRAEEIVAVSLSGKSSIADYLVIASGRSSRQLVSTAEILSRQLREVGESILGIEGMQQGDWVLIDAGTVIVHLFRPEIRSLYRLEEMWGMEESTAVAVGFA
ncbi:MAG: ribosome silencing factor [Alphaproteobacteria bacterium]|nr:ribosome silencing factor [Alphaproteobacteria bacterium]